MSPRCFWSLVGCGVVAVACSASQQACPPAPAAAAPQPADAAPQPTALAGTDDPDVRQEIQRVLDSVSRMRQLAAIAPVAGRIIDRSTMLKQVKQQVRTQVPSEAIRGESAFLNAFGFIPDDFDYEAGVYRLIESQLAGYYDPHHKTLFLMDDLHEVDAEVTLAHELVHALQDQHYDLGPRLAYHKDANDTQAAIHCLAEGDATSLMLDFSMADSGVTAIAIDDDRLRLEIISNTSLSPELASFPRVLRRSLIAPYVDGVLFVHALRRRNGWSSVDEVWQDPPTTTEQVLHIDKLDAREPAEPVGVPTPPRDGTWIQKHTEVYGEQGLRIALEDWMPHRAAVAAAAGWAGDRAVVFALSGHDTTVTVAAWHLRFDASAKPGNDEATEALRAIASGWKLPSGKPLCREIDGGRHLAAVKNGRSIALVAGLPSSVVGTPRRVATCAQLLRWANRISSQNEPR